MDRTTYGLDIAKNVMQLHWVNGETGEIGRKKLARAKLGEFFAQRQPARVAMEACGSAHHWARVLGGLGHKVELLPARQVRAFVRSNKDDAADARAIWLAAQHVDIRRAPVKAVEQQAVMLASDALHYYENYTQRRPVQVTMNVPQALDAYDTISYLVGDDVVGGHDPLDQTRFSETARGIYRIA